MKRTWILTAVALLLSVASPAWAQMRINSTTNATTLVLTGFEDDTVGASPYPTTIGEYWYVRPETIAVGGAVVINDVTPGPFAGANYLKINRVDGAANTAQLDELFGGEVVAGSTISITFAFLYKSTDSTHTGLGSDAFIQLYSGGGTRRLVLVASPDLDAGDTNFYVYNGNISVRTDTSLPVTPGTWQTIKITYTSGSTNLTLTVNGTPETLVGAVTATAGTINRVRFACANFDTIYYIDDLKVEYTPPPPSPLFLDNGFEDDIAGTNPNAPTKGAWNKPTQTTIGARVITNGVTTDNFSGTNYPFSGTNYLRIQRLAGAEDTAQEEAHFGTVAKSNTTSATFAFLYESTGSSEAAFRLYMGPYIQHAAIMAAPDLSGDPNIGTTNFYIGWSDYPHVLDYNKTNHQSSLAVTPGKWQTIKIEYTSGSTNLTLTVNGTSETLMGAVNILGSPNTGDPEPSSGTIDRIIFSTGNTNTTYYLDAVNPLTVSIETLPDKNEKLTFAGGPGGSTLVQATTNLTDWISISTNPATGLGPFIYSDLTATNYTQRFYRGVSQ